MKLLFCIFLFCLFIASFVMSFWCDFVIGMSFYGLFMIIYFMLQIIFSFKNHQKNRVLAQEHWIQKNTKRKIENHHQIVEEDAFRCILLMVGHREREEYWIKALRSIKNLDPERILNVVLIVDGNEPEDKYMKDIFNKIFDAEEHHYPFPIECIEISKRGKRGAMFYGIEWIRNHYVNMEKSIDIVVSDSDTELRHDSIIYLQECLRSNLNNGCATGLLTIYNKQDGLLPKIINARYAYAFMIERGCSSYFGCMTCCSGPLSIYRLDRLNDLVLRRFITQKFLTVKCEPGDDRHLTNMMLAQGSFSRQTNMAVAGTEAPETMFRFLNQQLRWSRSYYRELYWQVKAIPHQSLFLAMVTAYETLFPFFISIWIVTVLFFQSDNVVLLKGFIISLSVLLTRTVVLMLYLRDISMIYNLFYYILYILFLLPTKLWAVFSLINNNWVTHPRKSIFRFHCSSHFMFLFLWNIILGLGIGRRISLYFSKKNYF